MGGRGAAQAPLGQPPGVQPGGAHLLQHLVPGGGEGAQRRAVQVALLAPGLQVALALGGGEPGAQLGRPLPPQVEQQQRLQEVVRQQITYRYNSVKSKVNLMEARL